ASYLITGASRGLGLELSRQLAAFPASEVSKVFATSRGSAPKLDELAKQSNGRIVVVKLDVTDQETIKSAAKEVEASLGGKGLDVLINNAGIMEYAPNGVKAMDNLESSFKANVLGTHWVTAEFFPLLQKGNLKKVVNITSTFGSIALFPYSHYISVPAYKVTKAALNALTVQYSLDYGKEGFTFFSISPGWLRTDLGSEAADLSVEDGAKATLDRIINAGPDKNGQNLNIKIEGWKKTQSGEAYDGANPPW
ncbi:short chain dehydrogenase reductase, partial [Naematelia encephala]